MKQPTTYYNVKESRAKIQIHQGGTRSGKTYSIIQALCEFCFYNQDARWTITVVRKTFPSLRASVLRDFLSILESQDWYDVTKHNKSDNTYFLFGNLFEFISVDQPQKIRGRKRNVLFINEANELTLEDWRQLILRTTHKAIIDYNPSDEFSWIYDHLLPRDDSEFFKTTYKDNPYLSQEVVDEIERLRETDDNYWRVFGLGERGVSMTTIFTKWEEEEVPEGARLVAYGLDWGYTNDPSALIAVYAKGHNLWMHELLYRTGLTNPDLVIEIRKHIAEGDRTEIIADSSEPKSIEELFRHGLNCKPSKKGADSVRIGIDVMKRHRLRVTPTSTNLIKELRNYKWIQDKNGRTLNQPEQNGYDHAIDAVRYVCLNKLTKNFSGQYAIR